MHCLLERNLAAEALEELLELLGLVLGHALLQHLGRFLDKLLGLQSQKSVVRNERQADAGKRNAPSRG